MKQYLFNNSVLTADVLFLKHHKLDRLGFVPISCVLERENGAGRQSLPLTGQSRAGPSPLFLSCW